MARRSGWEVVGDSPEGREPERGSGGSDSGSRALSDGGCPWSIWGAEGSESDNRIPLATVLRRGQRAAEKKQEAR